MDVTGSGVGGNMASGVQEGFSASTNVPQENIIVQTGSSQRRLEDRKLTEAAISIRAHYIVIVDRHVPSSVILTGSEMAQLLHASNHEQLTAAILAGLQGTYFASENISITIKEIGAVEVASINVATSTSSQVGTSSTKASTILPGTTKAEQLEVADRGSKMGVSHLLFLTLAIANFLL
jgi:hypothetical protein